MARSVALALLVALGGCSVARGLFSPSTPATSYVDKPACSNAREPAAADMVGGVTFALVGLLARAHFFYELGAVWGGESKEEKREDERVGDVSIGIALLYGGAATYGVASAIRCDNAIGEWKRHAPPRPIDHPNRMPPSILEPP